MVVRAVVFDYGMVLSGPVNSTVRTELIAATGLSEDRFEQFYWADRHAYDEGKLSGVTFWQKFARDSGLALTSDKIDQLNRLDAQMWTTFDPAMIVWQQELKALGIRTAILSNMGDSVLESIERAFAWVAGFDVLVWSYQLGIAKPDPAIYRHLLDKLGTRPEETLFLDDKRINIEAAKSLGMLAIEFTNLASLCAEMIAAGLDKALPLPAVAKP